MLGKLLRKSFGVLRLRSSNAARATRLDNLCHQAVVLSERGEKEKAIAAYDRVLAEDPEQLEALSGLALQLLLSGRNERALAIAADVVERTPASDEAWMTLAYASHGLGLMEEALHAAEQAIAIKIDVSYISFTGVVLFQLGRVSAAVKQFDRALTLSPDDEPTHSNRLFALTLLPGFSRQQLLDAHFEWGKRVDARFASFRLPHTNDRSRARKLRVGYLSPDLRHHPVSALLEPILEKHDHAEFEIYCYDCQPGTGDVVTQRLRRHADRWIACGADDYRTLANRIRSDKIDILVDLAGHTAWNRLPVFAMRPAPVQVSWFGYMNTTGLKSIDYRLADETICPIGSKGAYTEKIVRLPAVVAWAPAANSPDIVPPPLLKNGYVTLGSVNNWTKTTDAVIACWSQILLRSPQARLRIVASGGGTPQIVSEIQRRFYVNGVPAEQLVISGPTSLSGFLDILNEIDIVLDPFPYNGGTTSFHAFWMGVPIVSLRTDEEYGRAGFGILSSVGLAELFATTVENYIEIAIALMGDFEKLRTLRAELRNRLTSTNAMNAGVVTLSVEAAYKTMWHDFLDQHDPA
jgi:protein O-GlcNAc transferase